MLTSYSHRKHPAHKGGISNLKDGILCSGELGGGISIKCVIIMVKKKSRTDNSKWGETRKI